LGKVPANFSRLAGDEIRPRRAHISAMSRKVDPFAIELTPELIIRAYTAGIFPMAEDAGSPDLFWVAPERRGILPLEDFHVSRSLRKTLRRHPFSVRIDTDFDAVIEACATVGEDRGSTWINPTIRRLYGALFDRGLVHTVEVWDGPELVGGLYGLALGAVFFGESMFHRRTDASKIALAHLVERLNAGGYRLLDTQFVTEHLKSLGGVEIQRSAYEARLADGLGRKGDFFAWDRLQAEERR
jgi:leucyl/phenylalanyl-tRNA--protein transferase